MKKKITVFSILVLAVVYILIIGTVIFGITYISTPKISLVADSTCAFPCWNNVKLDETNKAEFLKILVNVLSIDQSSIHRGNTFNDTVIFNTYPDWVWTRNTNGQAWFRNDKAIEMTFLGNTGMTLTQAIQKLGLPDHVYASRLVETSTFNVKIFFKEKNVIIGFLLYSIEDDIVSDQKITFIDLVDPNLYQDLLENGHFTDGLLDYTRFIPWSGYGKIKDKYLGK